MMPLTQQQCRKTSVWTWTERLGLTVSILCVLAFGLLAVSISLPGTQSLDETIIRALRNPSNPAEPRGPNWLLESARDYTALGGYAVLLSLTTLVCLFLKFERRPARVRFILVTVLSGYVLSMILKQLIDRPRPAVVPHLSYHHSSSFPSAHSMMSVIVYLTMGLMLSELALHRRVKVFLVVAPLTIAALVATSRVVMGVHYPTDVCAGWCAGVSWALSCWLTMRRHRARQIPLMSVSESEQPVQLAHPEEVQ